MANKLVFLAILAPNQQATSGLKWNIKLKNINGFPQIAFNSLLMWLDTFFNKLNQKSFLLPLLIDIMLIVTNSLSLSIISCEFLQFILFSCFSFPLQGTFYFNINTHSFSLSLSFSLNPPPPPPLIINIIIEKEIGKRNKQQSTQKKLNILIYLTDKLSLKNRTKLTLNYPLKNGNFTQSQQINQSNVITQLTLKVSIGIYSMVILSNTMNTHQRQQLTTVI